jgi:hypothetical protein
MMWIAGSLTAVVLPLLVLLLIFFTTNCEHVLQLTTLHGALHKKLTQLILHDFEQCSPRLSISNYKAQLLEGTSLLSQFFFLFLFSFMLYNQIKIDARSLCVRAFTASKSSSMTTMIGLLWSQRPTQHAHSSSGTIGYTMVASQEPIHRMLACSNQLKERYIIRHISETIEVAYTLFSHSTVRS